MKEKVGKIRQERKRLTAAFRKMGFVVPESQANFFLATRTGRPTAESLYKNLKNRHILVRYFPHMRLKHSLRITVGTSEQNNRLLAQLKAIMRTRNLELVEFSC